MKITQCPAERKKKLREHKLNPCCKLRASRFDHKSVDETWARVADIEACPSKQLEEIMQAQRAEKERECQRVRCVADSSRICPTPLQVSLVNRFLVWQFMFFLAGAVVVGDFIRRRQWQRICRDSHEPRSLNIVDRIEKVEEDLRSSTTIVRVLSRQLEKLGIRFRVMKKTLKEPINEAAALAQKNFEATRALAMQEEMLERELAEIQNVLLAMQEQQKRQLELILATGRSEKLRESRLEWSTEDQTMEMQHSVPNLEPLEQMEAMWGRLPGVQAQEMDH